MKLAKRWVAAGAVLLAAFLLALWLRPAGLGPTSGQPAGGAKPAAPATQPGKSLDDLLAAGQRARTNASSQDTQVEICGHGVFDARTDERVIEALGERLDSKSLDVLRRAGLRLATRADVNERAVGLWAQFAAELSRWMSSDAYKEQSTGQTRLPMPPPVTRPLSELIRLAADSGSPAVYRLALSGCLDWGLKPTVCNLISWTTLAELEPDNAANWLQVAGQAQLRGDTAAWDDAMRRAIAAPRHRVGVLYASGTLATAMEGLAEPALQHSALVRTIGIEAMLSVPQNAAFAASRWCPEPQRLALSAARQKECVALGQRLQQSDDITLAGIGYGIQGRFASSDAERAQIKAQSEAVQRARLKQAEPEMGPGLMSCAGIAATRARLQRVAQIGEAGVAREVLAREAQAAQPATR
jgi:hypothetical protein